MFWRSFVFFYLFSDLNTTVTYVLMDNFCPCLFKFCLNNFIFSLYLSLTHSLSLSHTLSLKSLSFSLLSLLSLSFSLFLSSLSLSFSLSLFLSFSLSFSLFIPLSLSLYFSLSLSPCLSPYSAYLWTFLSLLFLGNIFFWDIFFV